MSSKIAPRGRLLRHSRVRRKISGVPNRPRLAVFRSSTHIYAQLIDDTTGNTLASSSTVADGKAGAKIASAENIGKLLAERAKAAGIDTVVFDRGGFRYHGRVAAVAEGARKAGLRF